MAALSFCLVFVSGGLALVYEILWIRRFAFLFGATTPATAAVIAAVFCGLTAGGLFFGRLTSRIDRPLLLYGLLEIGASVAALGVEPILASYQNLYPFLTSLTSASSALLVKIALAMGAIFLPSFFLGGTLPALVQLFTPREKRLGISAGSLYAFNTFGAAAGALSVPFFWLPALGMGASYRACVWISLSLGTVACAVGIKVAKTPRISKPIERKTNLVESRPSASVAAIAFMAGLSGFLTFVLEVMWERMFAQVHENSIYSFALVLGLFLLGLGGGAIVVRTILARGWRADQALVVGWFLGGLVVLVTPRLFYWLTDGLSYISGGGGWTSYAAKVIGLGLPIVLLPAIFGGMVLPLLMELAGQRRRESGAWTLGWLLAVNTGGAMAGALAAAFLFPRWAGLWLSVALCGAAMCLTGAWRLAIVAPFRHSRPSSVALSGLTILAFLGLDPVHQMRTRIRSEAGERLVAIEEGTQGIVAVIEAASHKRLKLDNHYVLGGTASTGDERVQAHLPLLLHPDPRRIAFLGLGTGITAGAATLHDSPERITVIEIVPEVLDAARIHFAEANLGVLQSSKVEAIVDDARQVLLSGNREFDVIIGDLVVPWRKGESGLFSLEHFRAARRALTPGGIFCQWLPLFQLSQAEFNVVASTFLRIFPKATVWRGDFAPDKPALALVGHLELSSLDPSTIEQNIKKMRSDPSNPHLTHPAGFWIYFVGQLDGRLPRFQQAKEHSENYPWLELLGPMAHAGAEHSKEPVFAGAELADFLDAVRSASLGSPQLTQLAPEQLLWAEVGAEIVRATLLMEKGNRQGELRMRQAVARLPGPVRSAFRGN